jgi:integrase
MTTLVSLRYLCVLRTVTPMQRTPGKHGIADMWYRPDGTPTKLAEPGSTKKQPRGEGSRWRAYYIDSNGQERTKRFATKPPAQSWLNSQTAALTNGTHVDPKHGKTTLLSFYADFSQHQPWEHSTRLAMQLAVGSTTFGDMPLSELRTSHIQAWVKSMQDKPLEPSTIRTRVTNVRVVIRAAVRDRVLGIDPSEGVKLPRQRKAAAAIRIPTPEEVGRMLDGAAPSFRAFIGLGAFGGLRLGEAAALKVSDIDFLKREIRVERQVQRRNGGLVEIRAPKCGSERTVYAPDGLMAMLSEHIRAFGRDDLLFPGEGDQPLHRSSVAYRWGTARAGAGVSFRFHDLRHFYASGLISAGCDVVTVQRALGHANASITLNTYSHLWPNADDRTRNAAAELFDSAYAVRTIAAK